MRETLQLISRFPKLFQIVEGDDGSDVYFVDQGISKEVIQYNYIGQSAVTTYDLRMFCHNQSIYFTIKNDAILKGNVVSWNDRILEHHEFMVALLEYNFRAYKIVDSQRVYYDLVNIIRQQVIDNIVSHE